MDHEPRHLSKQDWDYYLKVVDPMVTSYHYTEEDELEAVTIEDTKIEVGMLGQLIRVLQKFVTPMLAFLLWAGCGSSGGNSVAPAPEAVIEEDMETSTLYVLEEDMPACIPQYKRRLVYVSDTAEFRVCDGEEWSVVEIKGPQGEAGTPGTNGVDGANADIEYIQHCVLLPFSDNITDIEYRFIKFKNGDAFVKASVVFGSMEVSDSDYYHSSLSGSDLGGAVIHADKVGAINGGFWVFKLDLDTRALLVEYNDTDLANPETDTFLPSDCTTLTF